MGSVEAMATIHAFGPFRLDADAEILFRGSEPLPVGKRAVALLRVLVERVGVPVSKDTLIDTAWAGLAVEESNLTVQIAALRRVLGVEPGGDKWIETLPRRGYRFVGPPIDNGISEVNKRQEASPVQDAAMREVESPDAAAPHTEPERRQLSVMSCELVWNGDDLEDLREAVRAYQSCVTAIVRGFRGFTAKHVANTVLVYFGYPEAHEDDAELAVRAGLALCTAVSSLRVGVKIPLHCRVGIATGMVIIGDLVGDMEGRSVIGEPPSIAARLHMLAQPSTVVIDDATQRLIGKLFDYCDVGVIEPGTGDPISTWRVLRISAVDSRFEALRTSTLTPFVGRDEELELILRRWGEAKRGQGRVVVVTGEPGIGKSRLLRALQEKLGAELHGSLIYHCSPHHQDSALHPVISQLVRAAGIEREDTVDTKLGKLATLLTLSGEPTNGDMALLAAMLSIPAGDRFPLPSQTPRQLKERTLGALVGLMHRLCAHQPMLLLFEDLHWIDPTSLELLTRIVEHADELGLLLLATARPEFAAPWPNYRHISGVALSRLDRTEGQALIAGISHGKVLPFQVLDQIIARTDGVPLFIEELTKTVLESGLLREGADRYELSRPLPPLAIPSTLHASLLARLDRLSAGKDVAQIGATIGRGFSYELVAAVAAVPEKDLKGALAQLVDAELVFQRGDPPHANFQFKHALVQDAAYASLIRSRRTQLHGAIARVLQEQFPDIVATEPQTLAHHLTEAGQWELAIGYWLEAGEQALSRPAYVEAANHLIKGIEVTQLLPASPERDRKEADLQIRVAQANRTIKGPGAAEAKDAFARAHYLLGGSGSLSAQMIALDGLWAAHIVRGELFDARSVTHLCMALATRRGEVEATTWANRLTGATLWEMGAFADAGRHLQSAIDLHVAGENIISSSLAGSDSYVLTLTYFARTLWLLGSPEQAGAANKLALSRARNLKQPMSIAAVLWTETMMKLWESDPDRASTGADQLLAHCAEYGIGHYLPFAQFAKGTYLARFGDPQLGIEVIQTAIEKTNLWSISPMFPRSLAIAHARLGKPQVGLGWLKEALQRIEKTQIRHAEADIRKLRGELLLLVGRKDEAGAELERALAVARTQGARWWELLGATSLARLWRNQGKRVEAHNLLAPVYNRFSEGFNLPALKNAKALLEESIA
jgi:DNA-binding winged helix-turn-helix (wHTH) protein/tetratricopeptide (TPR) repeat protein/ABC-type transport system involved in cytochrome c biogenesis ATPase subunit